MDIKETPQSERNIYREALIDIKNCGSGTIARKIAIQALIKGNNWENSGWQPIETLDLEEARYVLLWAEYNDGSGHGFHRKGFVSNGELKVFDHTEWDFESKTITHWRVNSDISPPSKGEKQ